MPLLVPFDLEQRRAAIFQIPFSGLPTIRELSPSSSNPGSVTAVSRSVDGFPSFPRDERHEGKAAIGSAHGA